MVAARGEAGFFERVWRERCGFAAVDDGALTEAEVWAAVGEAPVLLYPERWARDATLREVVFAAASALLFRERYGDAATASAIANHPVLVRAVAGVARDPFERDKEFAAD